MARVEIPLVAQDSNGTALSGASIMVYERGTTTEVDVYATASGGSPLSQPLSSVNGHINGWVEEGSYDIYVEYGGSNYTHAWEAARPVLNALTKAGLTALESGDKIAWETGGGDFVELWAERIAAGLAVSQIDEFTSDTSAQYTWVWGSSPLPIDLGSGRLETSNGGADKDAVRRPSWPIPVDGGLQLKLHTPADPTKVQYGLFAHGYDGTVDPLWLMIGTGQYGNPAPNGMCVQGTGSTVPLLTVPGGTQFTPAPNTDYTLVLRRTGGGDTWIGEVYNGAGTTLLAATAATNYTGVVFGAYNDGQTPPGGFVLDWASGIPDNTAWIDSFALLTVQQEQRDLKLAVTPAGGVRTIKTLYGVAGSNSFRTDFALAADVASDADLAAHASDTTSIHGIANTADLLSKATLAALAPGDKVAWETGGGDFIELWSEVVPAGFAFETVYYNDWAANSLGSGWTTINGNPTFDTGRAYDNNSIGVGVHVQLDTDADDSDRVTIKVDRDATANNNIEIVAGFRNTGTGEKLELRYNPGGSGNSASLTLIEENGNNSDTESSLPFMATTADHWIRITRNGNNVTGELFRDTLDTPDVTVNLVLSGTPATRFGLGVTLRPIMRLFRSNSGGTVVMSDDFHFESKVSLAEQRDLYLAITPWSGVRTVKRIYGALGATGFRSDFVGGTFVYTEATKPSAVGRTGQIIHVTDGAAGSKFQGSDGSTWLPVA